MRAALIIFLLVLGAFAETAITSHRKPESWRPWAQVRLFLLLYEYHCLSWLWRMSDRGVWIWLAISIAWAVHYMHVMRPGFASNEALNDASSGLFWVMAATEMVHILARAVVF